MVCKSITLRGYIACSAVQETSTSAGQLNLLLFLYARQLQAVAQVRNMLLFMLLVAAETKEAETEEKEAPAKPKPAARAAKAPAKPLPQMMEEDVIPSLKAILEAQDDLSNIELSFQDNKV